MAPFREIQLSKFLYPNASSRFALLVLNEHLDYFPLQPLVQLWLHASWRICADGGANQVYDHLSSEPELQRRLIPNLILGDLDSLRTDVADFYRILVGYLLLYSC
ncbi:cAMP-dependent protein kinase subunit [Coelomomyces lativittatus]|nr:cAMP-dependent protein kinase subunit [Coelomomyces lativittatus]